MRKERHIYFEEELYQMVNEYSLNKRKSINDSVNTLIKLGIDADSNINLVTELKSIINRIDNNSYLMFMLLKQLYSDLEFPNPTDINKSVSLDKFFRKIKKDKYND